MTARTPLQATAPLEDVGAGVWSLWRGAQGLPASFSPGEPFAERRLALAITDYVWRPLFTVAALAGLIGLIAGLLCASVLKRVHVELAVIPGAAAFLAAQASPLLVGMFAAGRVSVALATRMGGMQLEGEIDALTLSGHEPGRFILGPILASLMMAAPILTLVAAVASLAGAGVVLNIDAVVPLARFWELAATQHVAQAALGGLVRGYAYVILAVAAGGAAGTRPVLDLRDLEHRTTVAFTAGLLVVFSAAAISALW